MLFHNKYAGVKKDTAVYNAIIAALQLAAQRQATEVMKNRNGGIISDAGAVTGISSADLLEKAQLIYAEGLKDGQLQHYAYDSLDAPNNKGQKKAFISPTNLFPVSELLTVAGATDYSLPLPNTVPSSPPTSQPVAAVVDEGSGTDTEPIMINLNQFANGSPARSLDMNSCDEVAVPLPLGLPPPLPLSLGLSLPPPLRLPIGLPIAQRITFDNIISASIQSQGLSQSQSSISNTKSTGPRILDLHKCPLLIAEAAIDYEMKLIYDECVTEGTAHENNIGINMPTDSYAEHTSSSSSSSSSSSGSSSSSSSSGGSSSGDGSSCSKKGDLAIEPLQVLRSRRSSRHNRKKIPGLVPSEHLISPTAPPLPHPSHAPDIPTAPLVDSWKPKTCAFDLHIVTGRGRHINSSGTRGVLRFNIKDYLLDTYDIVADRISGNDGCIIVTSSSINQWITRMQSLSENAT